MTELLDVMRKEKKYQISLEMYKRMSTYFSKVLREDKNNLGEGYMVRSLYFDSLSNSDYQDKMDGLNARKKIRLRIYNTASTEAKLEMKEKVGEDQRKRSLTISKEDAIALIEGKYSVLLSYSEAFAEELYFLMNFGLYRPVCIVEYKRMAFIVPENKIRLTFDHDVVATGSDFNLFSKHLNLYPAYHKDNIIFEVKYNYFLLSYIKDMINACDKKETSVSKYCLVRSVSHFI